MSTVPQLLRTLAKVQALRARAGTPGEQRAAAQAAARILARLREVGGASFGVPPAPPPLERAILHRFSIRDPWARRLFLALLERDGFDAIRYPRQREHTVRVRAPEAAMERLWSEFRALSERLRRELRDVTDRLIHSEILAAGRRR